MYEIIKSVILSKDYKLEDMIDQIKKYCLYGDITTEQEAELISLAREYALPENSYADIQKQIDELFEKFNTLATTVEANAKGMAALKETVEKLGGTVTVPEEPEPEEEYHDYKPPSGAHDAYYKDAKIIFNGDKYICIAPEGVAVVWDPITYPAYWQKVTE